MADDLFDFLDTAEPTHAAADPAPDEASAPLDEQPQEPLEATEIPEGDEPAATEPLETQSEAETTPEWWHAPEAQTFLQQAQKDRAEADAMRQLRAVADQARAIQQQQSLTRTINELAEGDTDRHGQILNVLAQVAQPLHQQATANEQRATQSEKSLTAFLIAAQARLEPTQFESVKGMVQQLMAVDGPELMERLAFADRDAEKSYTPKLAAAEQKIAELERRLSAQVRTGARAASGADAIDGGRGMPGKTQGAETFDDFFAEMWRGN